ncbi:hypothetical protein NP233_g6624 [Leucocoprinus birnbaumii]|uniref:Uncharacterized protein n=1 Tax=Leucocoprinus birnbaumii TaxID=56174 RepID=A0AAD5VW98_9AGAR|nr:hypothetical protein NP233_g6624 [Leucocoprinus birnbaumii]
MLVKSSLTRVSGSSHLERGQLFFFLPLEQKKMVDLLDPLAQVRATSITGTTIAVFLALLRLYTRARKSQLSFEDVWALVSMIALAIQMGAVFIRSSPARFLGSPAVVARDYLIGTMFYATIWSARLSILFLLINIDSRTAGCYQPGTRRTFVIAFLTMWIFLTAQIFWECETKTAWKGSVIPQCKVSSAVPICQIISGRQSLVDEHSALTLLTVDVTSDGILLLYSTKQLRPISNKKLRLRLTLIFGTCIMTTIVSACHATYLFQSRAHAILISALVESAMSLIVCNIPTAVTTAFDLKGEKLFLSSPDKLPTLPMPDSIDHEQDFSTSAPQIPRPVYLPLRPL